MIKFVLEQDGLFFQFGLFLQVTFTEEHVSFFHFLTNVCAIIGGNLLYYKLFNLILFCIDVTCGCWRSISFYDYMTSNERMGGETRPLELFLAAHLFQMQSGDLSSSRYQFSHHCKIMLDLPLSSTA